MRLRINSKESIPQAYVARAQIFKLYRSPRIDSKESIPQAYVAWLAGMKTLIPTRLLALECLKIPAL